MTFRNMQLSGISLALGVKCPESVKLTPADKAHSTRVDYSNNRLHELGGVPNNKLATYLGRKTSAVIDTETTCENGDNFGKPLIYDIGVTFVDMLTGEPVGKACFIVSDIFCNAALMKGAFFTNRVFTDYPYILNNGIANLVTFKDALERLAVLFKHFNCAEFSAYNSAFDTKAFDATAEYLDRNLQTPVHNFGLVSDIRNGTIDVLDLWAASCQTFMSHNEYKECAVKHDWKTNTHNFITSAEAANNFINNGEVGEDHTALSDTAIEAGIYKYILDNYGREELDQCLNSHGETWAFVNNLGKASFDKWIATNHPRSK